MTYISNSNFGLSGRDPIWYICTWCTIKKNKETKLHVVTLTHSLVSFASFEETTVYEMAGE